jgi:putative transposase
MSYDPNRHHRQSIRLKNYDYSQAGAYFVTIVSQNRQHVFGKIENGVMIPNPAGTMIKTLWYGLPERFVHVDLDAFIVMPNHIHGIIIINHETTFAANPSVGAGLVPAPAQVTHQTTLHETNDEMAFVSKGTAGASLVDAPTQTDTSTSSMPNQKRPILGDVVGVFKSLTTHAYIMGVRENGWIPFEKRLWQRNFYEHVIRSNTSLTKIRAYIETNLQNWERDAENT